jgi:hypothetical protein
MNLVLREDIKYSPSLLIRLGTSIRDIDEVYTCFNKDSLYRYEKMFIEEGILFENIDLNEEYIGIVADYDFPNCLTLDEKNNF